MSKGSSEESDSNAGGREEPPYLLPLASIQGTAEYDERRQVFNQIVSLLEEIQQQLDLLQNYLESPPALTDITTSIKHTAAASDLLQKIGDGLDTAVNVLERYGYQQEFWKLSSIVNSQRKALQRYCILYSAYLLGGVIELRAVIRDAIQESENQPGEGDSPES